MADRASTVCGAILGTLRSGCGQVSRIAATVFAVCEGILPIAKRHNVGAFNWGLVAGKTQTYLPWDSWDHPYTTPPKVWFSDLLQPDGRPYQDSEIQTIRSLTGGLGQT